MEEIEGDEKDDVKRKCRNLSEKKRRDQFNLLINELASMVAANNRKMDKSTVLKATIAFFKNQKETSSKGTAGGIGGEQGSHQQRAREDWQPSFLSNEEFTHLMLEALDGFIMTLSRSGKILYTSESITPLLGHIPSEVNGCHLCDLMPEEEQDEMRKFLSNPALAPGIGASWPEEYRERYTIAIHIQRGSAAPSSVPVYERVHLTGYFERYKCPSEDGVLEFSCSETEDHVGGGGGGGGIGGGENTFPFEQSNHRSSEPTKIVFVAIARLEHPQLLREMVILEPTKSEFTSRHSLEWKFLFLDHRAPTIIGYLPFEVLGTSGYDYYHVDDLEKVAQCHEVLMKKGKGTSCFYRFLTKGQQWIWLKTHYYITYHQWNSKPEFVVCTNMVVSYGSIKGGAETKEKEKEEIESESDCLSKFNSEENSTSNEAASSSRDDNDSKPGPSNLMTQQQQQQGFSSQLRHLNSNKGNGSQASLNQTSFTQRRSQQDGIPSKNASGSSGNGNNKDVDAVSQQQAVTAKTQLNLQKLDLDQDNYQNQQSQQQQKQQQNQHSQQQQKQQQQQNQQSQQQQLTKQQQQQQLQNDSSPGSPNSQHSTYSVPLVQQLGSSGEPPLWSRRTKSVSSQYSSSSAQSDDCLTRCSSSKRARLQFSHHRLSQHHSRSVHCGRSSTSHSQQKAENKTISEERSTAPSPCSDVSVNSHGSHSSRSSMHQYGSHNGKRFSYSQKVDIPSDLSQSLLSSHISKEVDKDEILQYMVQPSPNSDSPSGPILANSSLLSPSNVSTMRHQAHLHHQQQPHQYDSNLQDQHSPLTGNFSAIECIGNANSSHIIQSSLAQPAPVVQVAAVPLTSVIPIQPVVPNHVVQISNSPSSEDHRQSLIMSYEQQQLQEQLRRKHSELQQHILRQQEELRKVNQQLIMAQYGVNVQGESSGMQYNPGAENPSQSPYSSSLNNVGMISGLGNGTSNMIPIQGSVTMAPSAIGYPPQHHRFVTAANNTMGSQSQIQVSSGMVSPSVQALGLQNVAVPYQVPQQQAQMLFTSQRQSSCNSFQQQNHQHHQTQRHQQRQQQQATQQHQQ